MQNYKTYTKQKRSLELKWEQEHLKEGRYTLRQMVRIRHKIREVITDKKNGRSYESSSDK